MLNEKQIFYKRSIENIIKKYMDFNKLDIFFEKISTPVLNDTTYNPNHMNSTLGSKYIYLRNNYYIDKLDEKNKEILETYISNDKLLPLDFILETAEQVLFEEGDYVMINYNTMNNAVKSKSLIFEFAYDLNACTELEQIKKIEKTIKELFTKMQEQLEKSLKIPLSIVVYKAMPDIYKQKNIII